MAPLDHYAIEELLSDKERTARDLGRGGLCRKRRTCIAPPDFPNTLPPRMSALVSTPQ